MTALLDVTSSEKKLLLSLLQHHLPNTIVWAYGSRVKGTALPSSDLDLVVFITPEKQNDVSALRDAFDESNLPFRVDLFVWDDIPETFRKTIQKEHVTLQEKAK